MGEKTKPAFEYKAGRIRGACWLNPGKAGPWYSVRVDRTYTDEHGVERSAQTFGRDDLLVVAEVLRVCWMWIVEGTAEPTPTPRVEEFDDLW